MCNAPSSVEAGSSTAGHDPTIDYKGVICRGRFPVDYTDHLECFQIIGNPDKGAGGLLLAQLDPKFFSYQVGPLPCVYVCSSMMYDPA